MKQKQKMEIKKKIFQKNKVFIHEKSIITVAYLDSIMSNIYIIIINLPSVMDFTKNGGINTLGVV